MRRIFIFFLLFMSIVTYSFAQSSNNNNGWNNGGWSNGGWGNGGWYNGGWYYPSGGGVPSGVSQDDSGNYLQDDSGNYLQGS